jgi:nucleoside-diphosphate-sugar epimerase
MKICVVGGNGNIGSDVVRRLLALGHQTTCFNRGLSGPVPEGARVIVGDRQQREQFEQRMRAEKFDAAIDLVCFTHEDAQSSIRAFRGVGHFVHCSSVATYGRHFDSYPTTEDHPLRPGNDYGIRKAQADAAFLAAHSSEQFPVTLLKPAITYGAKLGLLRQIGNDLGWIDRIRQGKPIIVAGDGIALHQFMHVEDAARAFALVVGRPTLIGQTYNLVYPGFTRWEAYHRTAMQVLGREVEMVGVPAADLLALRDARVAPISDVFSHNSFFSGEKFHQAVPGFTQQISLEAGMRQVIEALDRAGRIPKSVDNDWEDRIIAAQKRVRVP